MKEQPFKAFTVYENQPKIMSSSDNLDLERLQLNTIKFLTATYSHYHLMILVSLVELQYCHYLPPSNANSRRNISPQVITERLTIRTKSSMRIHIIPYI